MWVLGQDEYQINRKVFQKQLWGQFKILSFLIRILRLTGSCNKGLEKTVEIVFVPHILNCRPSCWFPEWRLSGLLWVVLQPVTCGTLFEAINVCSFSFLLSVILLSFRCCLKLPSLTLFTFSLFYRYQEETAWNPAVLVTLDKLHSHSKWIYINKEADTWQYRERWDNKRWEKIQKRMRSSEMD